MHVPPPDLAQAAAAQAVKPKKDPMSFPPGLIPQLVAEKLKTDPPYSPLSPLDIDRAGLPPTLEPDSYLKSRIDRFFAELQASHAAQHVVIMMTIMLVMMVMIIHHGVVVTLALLIDGMEDQWSGACVLCMPIIHVQNLRRSFHVLL